jgi:hypothetical protein
VAFWRKVRRDNNKDDVSKKKKGTHCLKFRVRAFEGSESL